MRLFKIGMAMLFMVTLLAGICLAGEEKPVVSTEKKASLADYAKSCIDSGMAASGIKELSAIFMQRIHAKDAGNTVARPLAQPGSYSLTPPHRKPDKESLRNLLRDTCDESKK